MSEIAIPDPASILAIRDSVVGQVKFVRRYTLGLLASVPDELWGVIPTGASTHFAWQVGHLAVAQYGLMLFRQRGRSEGDLELMPSWLRKQYGKGTVPATDPSKIPPRGELMGYLQKIYDESIATVPNLTAEQLAEPTEMPFAVYPIKLGVLLFCPIHEGLHAGQIGLLRRLHGQDPITDTQSLTQSG